ncbi:extracellular solute-binding protein [Sinorhizobium meliloti]|uniref:extracellular solute-binding protein n=1 Tax=Rhizobium meliloti TaxID=382 RepID=UPI000FD91E86|nr:extracellular solute-binding protein [Sinorhizobium meliloti]MDE3823627.1 extracellular solute-binding protein [Sinorhizobium meliloti]RVH13507.1 extracellular solute-binding protein [Sinorhizobium meliloti]RVI02049.1 extracellular solute-binding protein [Sinorhizobium meliloti]RVM43216.1 extracellular solute-binding protein [Sinorhizobium meliloti]RVN63061.1 extracellular solute-binding protein [Sinorhizobium meliloti]
MLFRSAALAFTVMTSLVVPQYTLAQTIVIASGSDNNELMEALAAAFEADNPGAFVDVPSGPRSYDELTQDLLRRATVGAPLPDLLVIGSNQRLFAERGLAQALDHLLETREESYLTNATPVVLEKGRIGSNIYGVAFGISLPVVLFNSELVIRVGADPENLPRDWNGILSLASKIDQLGVPIVGGYIETDGSGAINLLNLLQSHGGRMMSEDESVLTIDSSYGLAALTTLRQFGEVGQTEAAMSRDQARAAFAAGTIGVFVTMSSVITSAEAGSDNRFQVLSVPMPVVDGGSLAAAGPIASILTTDQERTDLAIRFIEFLVSPKGQEVVATSSGYYPLNKPAIDDSKTLSQLLVERPNAASIIDNLPFAGAWYTPPGANATRIARVTTDVLEGVVSHAITPEEAIDQLTSEIEPLLP